MEDKSPIGKILEAGGSVTISGKKDQPMSARISATFNGSLPKNSALVRDVLHKGGSVTVRPSPKAS